MHKYPKHDESTTRRRTLKKKIPSTTETILIDPFVFESYLELPLKAYLPLFSTRGKDRTFGDVHDWGSLLAKAPPAQNYTHDLRYAAVRAILWADALSSLATVKQIHCGKKERLQKESNPQPSG